jgi:hypothetical protein
MPSMDSVLNTKATEIKRAPPIPVGTYTLQIFGRPSFVDMSRQGKTDFVDFQTKIMAVGDTVSEDDLASYPGGRGALLGLELKGRAGARFYLSEAALPQLTEWLSESLGIDLDGKTLKEAIFEAPGHNVTCEMAQEPTQKGDGMQNRIASWARA